MEEGEDGHHEFDANQLREHEEFTKVKNVERIELGRFEMETWYFSPLPPEYKDCKVGGGAAQAPVLPPPHGLTSRVHALQKLYFVEGDLAFFKDRDQMLQHLRKCKLQHPPGDEIYRKGNLSMFEIDGKVPVGSASEQRRCWPARAAAADTAACCRRRSCTARTCATWPSCSWTTRRCTMTSTSSCFTSCVSVMSVAPTPSGEHAVPAAASAWRPCQPAAHAVLVLCQVLQQGEVL